ncbi:MAG: DUF481 domain-containing protein [Opitutaceae bacterium]|jgi:hypothetical protein|nr:DUF481 domain-containing protein [Opitutaceae bacterium]
MSSTVGKLVFAAFCVVVLPSAAGLRADVLKFKNGDQVHGAFVKKEGGQIFFRSDQFGDLSVREADATVEITSPLAPLVTETEVALATGEKPKPPDAEKPATAPSAAPPKPEGTAVAASAPKTTPPKPAPPKTTPPKTAPAKTPPPVEKPAVEKPKPPASTIARLGKGFIKWWGGWHGRIAFSMSSIHDTADRSLYLAELRVKRTWKHDEVQIEPRYEFRQDNNVTAVDIFKVSAYWRHTFGENWFAEYRPAYQRDRKGSKAEQLEQQFGVGRHILKSKQHRLHIGMAENAFNTWPLNRGLPETAHSMASLFSEASLQLPWRITVTDRGSWYCLGNGDATSDTGWQNTFELTKKLTNMLSFSFRYELRVDNPDPRVADYENTRFLLGFNF